jgi:hypothetical protein
LAGWIGRISGWRAGAPPPRPPSGRTERRSPGVVFAGVFRVLGLGFGGQVRYGGASKHAGHPCLRGGGGGVGGGGWAVAFGKGCVIVDTKETRTTTPTNTPKAPQKAPPPMTRRTRRPGRSSA